MGAFTTRKIIYGNTAQIPYVAEQLRQAFASEGYEVRIENTRVGREVYITNGGLFKAALGPPSLCARHVKEAVPP